MSGSNYSFTSGGNDGLNFSSNNSTNNSNDDSEGKSKIRMAGEVFSNQNDTSNSSNDAAGESTGSWWRNQYSDMVNSGSSSSSNTSADTNSTPSSTTSSGSSSGSSSGWSKSGSVYKSMEQTAEQKAAYDAQQQQAKDKLASRAKELGSSYDPAKYQYYESEFGSGTGAEAYGKDMANYESWVERNNSGLGAGHLGLVAQMMHPDWGRSQKTGGGNPIVTQDYSVPDPKSRGQKAAQARSRIGSSSGESSKY